MDNPIKNLCFLLVFLFFISFSITAQNSLPRDLDLVEYTAEQKVEIHNLLNFTEDILEEKLRRSRDEEYISKIIITNSYKFAKGYSDIMNSDKVPFRLVTSSTSFMGCWVGDRLDSPGPCWDKYLSKINGAEFASLED